MKFVSGIGLLAALVMCSWAAPSFAQTACRNQCAWKHQGIWATLSRYSCYASCASDVWSGFKKVAGEASKAVAAENAQKQYEAELARVNEAQKAVLGTPCGQKCKATTAPKKGLYQTSVLTCLDKCSNALISSQTKQIDQQCRSRCSSMFSDRGEQQQCRDTCAREKAKYAPALAAYSQAIAAIDASRKIAKGPYSRGYIARAFDRRQRLADLLAARLFEDLLQESQAVIQEWKASMTR